MQTDQISEALRVHTDRLLAVPGVVGTGRGSCAGQPCVLVLVARRTPALQRAIADILETVPFAIQETGEIRALDSTR